MGLCVSVECEKCGCPIDYYSDASTAKDSKSCRVHDPQTTLLEGQKCRRCDGEGNCYHSFPVIQLC